MKTITDLGEVQKVRAPAAYEWGRSAILADNLDVLHRRLAELSGILSRQLDSVDSLLSILAQDRRICATAEAVKVLRVPLMEADRLLSQERDELQALREQRFEIYGSDTVGPRESGPCHAGPGMTEAIVRVGARVAQLKMAVALLE